MKLGSVETSSGLCAGLLRSSWADLEVGGCSLKNQNWFYLRWNEVIKRLPAVGFGRLGKPDKTGCETDTITQGDMEHLSVATVTSVSRDD